MIFIAGISIALFISALLFVKKDKSKADYFLLLWMILNAVHLTFFYLFLKGGLYDYPHFLGFQIPLPLLHGVLLYYYVSAVTNQFSQNRVTVLLHLIPFLLANIYLIPFYLSPENHKIEVFKNEGQGYETFQQVLMMGVFLSGIIYVIWSSILLKKHKKRIRNQFSDIEDISLNWLQFLVYGLGLIWVVVIFTQNDTFIFIGVSIFVIMIGFFGVQQKNIFGSQKTVIKIVEKERVISKEKVVEKEKYVNSGLSNELSEKLYANLNQLMKTEKVFTNSELSLNELADKLETHPNYLSQIINKQENKSFYDYINTYRVEEYKRLIAIPENQNFTLIALAYDCGFNSKSSFNRYFKKITGQTPSQYSKTIMSK